MMRYIVLVVLLGTSGAGQIGPAVARNSATSHSIPSFDVNFEPDPNLSVPFSEAGYPAVFADGCDTNGNPYVRVSRIIAPNSAEILRFDTNGIVTFETSKITDVVEPKWAADYILDARVYILIEGDTHTERQTKKLEDGKDAVSWDTKGAPQYYIARFDSDGSYRGALKLDLPFRPTRLSGFPSGQFLTAGLDENKKLHVALLDAEGQLLRYIEFAKEKQPSAKTTLGSLGLNASEDLASMVVSGSASFFPYQDGVLYVRAHSGGSIYEIRPGGVAQAIKLNVPAGFTIEHFLPSDRNWFVISAEQGKIIGARSVIYEVNPSSGEFLGRYTAEGSSMTKSVSEGQSDLACFHEGEFISVRHQDGKLTVLRGSPVLSGARAGRP